MAAMDSTRRRQLVLGLGVSALVCLALVSNWLLTPGQESRTRVRPEAVQAEMHDITFLHGEQGRLVWRLRSRRADLGRDRDVVSMIHPDIEYAFQGNTTLIASSPKGEYNRANRTAAFWPRVSGTYGAARFTAGRMKYKAEKESLELRREVHVTRGNASIRSSRAHFDLNAQRVIFSQDAEVRLYGYSR